MKKVSVQLSMAVAFLLVMCGCAGPGVAKDKEAVEKALPKAEATAIALLAETCPLTTSDQSESLIAMVGVAAVQAFAPAVIGFGYDLAVKALEDRADALTASTTAVAHGVLYKERTDASKAKTEALFSPKYRCLILVRGGFEASGSKEPSPIAKEWSKANLDLVNDALSAAKLKSKLVEAPELYAEFSLTYPTKKAVEKQAILGKDEKPLKGSDGKELVLQKALNVPVGLNLRPVNILYGKSGAKRNPDPVKQLVFQIGIKGKALKDGKWEETTLVEGLFDLGLVRIGAAVSASVLESKTAAYGTLIPPARIPVAVSVEGANGTDPGQVLALDLIDIAASISLTETQEGGDFERLLAKTAKDKKDSILKPLTDAIEALGKKKEDAKDGAATK